MKSMNMISTIGRSPVMAAPTAAPTYPISLIGVSMHPPGPEPLVEALRHREDASAGADVDADQHHRLVPLHRIRDSGVDRLEVAERAQSR